MATTAILSASNLDISKVTFGEIRMNKAGGKTVPIKYNGQNLQFRIPKMMYPMGVNVKETDNGTNYQLSATMKGCDSYAKERAGTEVGEIGILYNFLIDLQEKLLQTSIANSAKWFGKVRSKEVLSDSMKLVLSPSVELLNGEWVPTGKYPPSLRMKVPVYNGEVSMDVIDASGKPVEVTTDNLTSIFKKRVEASVIVSPSVYVSGQGFGITWRVTHARVCPPARLTAAQAFADELEEEVAETVPTASAAAVEEEEEQHQEEVSVPVSEPTPTAPVAAPAKNRRRAVGGAL